MKDNIFEAKIPTGKGVLCVLDSSGDTKISWSKKNKEEVENVRRTFNELVKEKKFAAFSVSKLGRRSKKVTEFDPNLQKLILVPPMAGGAFMGARLEELRNEQCAPPNVTFSKGEYERNDEAEIKAMTMLKNKIGITQFVKLVALGYIEVKGKYGIYKVNYETVTLDRTDNIGNKIRPLSYHLCVNVSGKVGYIPLADKILSLYLSIKENEDKFIEIANFRNVTTKDEYQERGETSS